MKKLLAVTVIFLFFCGCGAEVNDAAEEFSYTQSASVTEISTQMPGSLHGEITPAGIDGQTAPIVSPSSFPAEFSPLPTATASAQKKTIGVFYAGRGENARYLVAIDAGHQQQGISEKEPNGPGSSVQKAKLSSGTAGKATRVPEYQLNLTVSLALREELLNRGYSVYMIRTTNDAPVSNKERAEMANAAGADIFLRIHANGSEDPSVRGAMMVCQSRTNPYTQQYEASRRLSETVLQGYSRSTQIPKQKGNAVWETDTMTGINWCKVPSSTLEMGYMSNLEDDLAMAEEDFAPAAARGIADGIDAYFG